MPAGRSLPGSYSRLRHEPPPASSAPASHAQSAAPAAAPAALACSTVLADGNAASEVIQTLVQDQKSQNAALEEGWVNVVDGTPTSEGDDLQAAVTDFTPYATGSSQLASDAAAFDSDASQFLSDQSGGLMPGWPAEAGQVEQDIHNLAADCGIKMHVPKSYTV